MGPTATANSGDFVKAAPNPASGLHSLFAHLESLLKRARKGEGPLEEGLVHKVRVTCRRLRVVLTVLPPESLRETARPVRSCLGRLRRVAGEVRDCDVHLRLLEELDRARQDRKPAGLIDALAMAREDRVLANAALKDHVDAFRMGRFLRDANEMVAAIETAHAAAPEGSVEHLRTNVASCRRRLDAAGRVSPSTPTAFHELRLAVKAWRYAREALEFVGVQPEGDAVALAELQGRLGELNDLSTLADRLDRYAAAIDAQPQGEMLAPAKRQRDSLRSLAGGFRTIFGARARQFAAWWAEFAATGSLGACEQASASADATSRPPTASPATPSNDQPTPATSQPVENEPELWVAGRRVAIIDVGSNSVRLLAVELNGRRSWRLLTQERSMTRLAHGLTRHRSLCPEAMERSVQCIASLAARAKELDCTEVRAFATAAVREATNGLDFVARVKHACGVDIRVVTAAEEGLFTHASVARTLAPGTMPIAVADLGGGSLEVVSSTRGVVTANVSMSLGVVATTERFPTSEACGIEGLKAMRRGVDADLKAALPRSHPDPTVLVGCGGTFTTIAAIAAAARDPNVDAPSPPPGCLLRLTRAEVRTMLTRMASLPEAELMRVPGLPADRADIIVAGLVTVDRLMKRLGCKDLLVHAGSIREGVLMRAIDEMPPRTPEEASPSSVVTAARRLLARCACDRHHAEQVAALSLRLHDALVAAGCVPGLGQDPLERAMLEAAGLLHDTGMLVSYRGHHRHSEQIVLHNELDPLPRSWVIRLATICRHHRRKGPTERSPGFASLSETDRASVMRLAGILRVADGLDRSHAGVVADLRVTIGKRTLRIECDSGGIDMSAEVDAATRKADVLEAVTGFRACVARRDSLTDAPG